MTRSGIRRVAFIGPPGAARDSFKYEFDGLFQISGGNTGNYAFWHAVDRHFQNEREYFTNWSFDPARVRGEFDLVVLPCANFLHPGRDMGGLAHRLDHCRLPILAIGLGAQALDTSQIPTMKPGTVRFLGVLRERCRTIGLRGSFTAEVLEHYDVQNYDILGCPSNLINLSRWLVPRLVAAFDRVRSLATQGSRIEIAASTDLHRPGQYWLSRRLFDWIQQNDGAFVCQNPAFLVQAAREGVQAADEDVVKLHQGIFSQLTFDGFRSYVANRFVTFFSAEAWLEHLRRYDISIGTRFHGNMLALQAGVPAIFVAHDARTLELTEACAVPVVSLDRFRHVKTLDELLSIAEFDGPRYASVRRALARRYVGLLCDAGLTPAADLLAYLNSESDALDYADA